MLALTAILNSAHGSRPFVGRGPQLELVLDRLDSAGAGRGGVLLVSGPAGIGKTRLVEEALSRYGGTALVGRGQCTDDPGAPAFWPWSRALRAVDRAAGGTGLAGVLPGQRAVPAEPAVAVAERFRALTAATDALLQAAADRPLALVLEDLHWADAESLDLLRRVSAEAAAAPLLVLATHRDVLPDPSAAAIADIRRDPGTDAVPLPPLTEAEVGEYLGSPGAEAYRRTGGLPLLLAAGGDLGGRGRHAGPAVRGRPCGGGGAGAARGRRRPWRARRGRRHRSRAGAGRWPPRRAARRAGRGRHPVRARAAAGRGARRDPAGRGGPDPRSGGPSALGAATRPGRGALAGRRPAPRGRRLLGAGRRAGRPGACPRRRGPAPAGRRRLAVRGRRGRRRDRGAAGPAGHRRVRGRPHPGQPGPVRGGRGRGGQRRPAGPGRRRRAGAARRDQPAGRAGGRRVVPAGARRRPAHRGPRPPARPARRSKGPRADPAVRRLGGRAAAARPARRGHRDRPRRAAERGARRRLAAALRVPAGPARRRRGRVRSARAGGRADRAAARPLAPGAGAGGQGDPGGPVRRRQAGQPAGRGPGCDARRSHRGRDVLRAREPPRLAARRPRRPACRPVGHLPRPADDAADPGQRREGASTGGQGGRGRPDLGRAADRLPRDRDRLPLERAGAHAGRPGRGVPGRDERAGADRGAGRVAGLPRHPGHPDRVLLRLAAAGARDPARDGRPPGRGGRAAAARGGGELGPPGPAVRGAVPARAGRGAAFARRPRPGGGGRAAGRGRVPAARVDRLAAELGTARRRADPLTAREREVADLVVRALSNREIAESVVLSERTVESHVRSILGKLGLAKRAELIARRR